MLLAIDVHYEKQIASVAGVSFDSWQDSHPKNVFKTTVETPSGYRPGEFYRRELPCIAALLESFSLSPDTIIIDGFVYLDGYQEAGLGKHLFDSLEGKTCVIGVAKSRFKDIAAEFAILRGDSSRPLYVTCEGVSVDEAKQSITSMHGQHRIPTLLKLADSECKVH